MKFLTPLALLATTVAANPILARDGGKTFTLKTSSQKTEHNNLYVSAYHTGAGLNDAVLTKDAGTARPAVLNGTNVEFQLGGELTWGMMMPGDTNYADLDSAWEPVEINGGKGSEGFAVKDGQLEWDEKMGFGGWL
ncbi:hypothetical protein PHISCL_01981, partial [Aspergillus sclerotialis]